MSENTDRELRRAIRRWAEANEPSRAVECAVKLWGFINQLAAMYREAWMNRGFRAMWTRIQENEENQ